MTVQNKAASDLRAILDGCSEHFEDRPLLDAALVAERRAIIEEVATQHIPSINWTTKELECECANWFDDDWAAHILARVDEG